MRTPALRTTAQLGVTVLLVMGYPSASATLESLLRPASLLPGRQLSVMPAVTLRATASPGVMHHHHHHVVVLQGGAPHAGPPSKATMAALLNLPKQLVGQHVHGAVMSQRPMYQSVSTAGVGTGVTHQYHFHNAHDLHGPLQVPAQAPAPAPAPDHHVHPVPVLPVQTISLLDPEAEWYAKQQSARVVGLINKLRDLGVHVDEVHAEAPVNKDDHTTEHVHVHMKVGGKEEHKEGSVHAGNEEAAKPPGTNDDGSEEISEEQVRKEIVKFIAKLHKKQKEIHMDHSHSGWTSRAGDVAGDNDILAGGDLDVNVETPRSVYDEMVQLGADLGVHVGLPT